MARATHIAAVSLAVTLVLMTGCSKRPASAPKDAAGSGEANAKDPVKHRVLAFNLEGLTDKGEKKWDVRGQSAEAVSESQVMLDNIVANAYGDEGSATIAADKGIYDKANNSVRLEQNVHATIETKKGAGADFMGVPAASGPGIKGERPLGEAPAGKSSITITCEGDVTFEYEKNVAYFNTCVNVITEDGIIDADRITVYLNPETKKLSEIVAEGNVRISRGGNVTSSEKATYVEAEKKIVLSGRPKIILVPEGDFSTGFLDGAGGGKK